MPAPSSRLPSYCHHKASNRAFVRLNGAMHYLGTYGTAESRERYDALIEQWLSNQRCAVTPVTPMGNANQEYTIAEMVLGYLEEFERLNPPVNGMKHRELFTIESAMRGLAESYGTRPAKEFGPKDLKAVRKGFVERGLCRKVVNRYVQFVRNAFRFGVSEGEVPGEVWHTLCAVRNLRAGQEETFDHEPVKPVDEKVFLMTLAHLSAEVRAIAELQWNTGMRAGEVVIMRTRDIDMSGEVWLYRVAKHKNSHRGHRRVVPLGTKCQGVLMPFLKPEKPEDYLFSPQRAEEARREVQHAARATPLAVGNRPGTNRAAEPARPPGTRYTTTTYRRAIFRATSKVFELPEELKPDTQRMGKAMRQQLIAKLGKEGFAAHHEKVMAWYGAHRWTPHQLRHSAATNVAAQFGEAAAMSLLGQRSLAVTQRYVEPSLLPAIEVMRKCG